MIGVDEMQDYIRAANPVPSTERLDPDELAGFVANAQPSQQTSDAVYAELPPRLSTRRGSVLAVATAAVALGLVAIAVVLTEPFGSAGVSNDEPSRVASPAAQPASSVPDPALHTQRLIPVAEENPPPLATAIGDIEFEVLEFESPEHALWEVAWVGHSLVSIADGRLYWSTDYYNWESLGPVDGDEITVAGAGLIVHGGPGNPTRYSWVGDIWVESGLVLAGDVGQFAFGLTGAAALEGDTFLYSSDGVIFNPAEQAPRSLSEEVEQGGCPEGWGPALTEPLAATQTGCRGHRGTEYLRQPGGAPSRSVNRWSGRPPTGVVGTWWRQNHRLGKTRSFTGWPHETVVWSPRVLCRGRRRSSGFPTMASPGTA